MWAEAVLLFVLAYVYTFLRDELGEVGLKVFKTSSELKSNGVLLDFSACLVVLECVFCRLVKTKVRNASNCDCIACSKSVQRANSALTFLQIRITRGRQFRCSGQAAREDCLSFGRLG